MATDQFKIVSSPSLTKFEGEVSAAMADGWEKEGGPFQFTKTNSNGNPFPIIGQSMTRKAPKPPKPPKKPKKK